jgi:hypothetical protein
MSKKLTTQCLPGFYINAASQRQLLKKLKSVDCCVGAGTKTAVDRPWIKASLSQDLL